MSKQDILASQKQPRAMLPLCLTEMWERFGFYIIVGMLVLVVTNYFKLSDSQAVLLTGEYGALVYISPILGGYYADNYLGFRYSVLIGAFFQFIGYAFITTLQLKLIYLGLAFVILGNGLLKPNIASYLGVFYETNDPRRQAGFNYYYSIMNLGMFISTVFAGFIKNAFGWHVCFGIAAAGMIIGISVFLYSFRFFEDKGLPVRIDLIREKTLSFVSTSLLCGAALVTACYFLLTHAALGDKILLFIAAVMLIYLLLLTFHFKNYERRCMAALLLLIVFATVFWGIFFEIFSVINLFAERNVNRYVFGITLPPIVFLSLEGVFVILLGYPFAQLWRYLGRLNKSPAIITKFALALVSIAFAMHILSYSSLHFHNAAYLVDPAWVVIFYFFITIGEMLLSPNFLAAVTELAPKKVVGLMMGVQYMAIGFGSSISGLLGQMAASPKQDITSPKLTNSVYAHAFNTYALISLGTAIVIFLCIPLFKKLIERPDDAKKN